VFFWYLGAACALAFFTLGKRRIDFRLVMLGAVAPDFVDRALDGIWFHSGVGSPRLVGHALVAPVLLALVIMTVLRGATARRYFVIPVGWLLHLALDGTWSHPITFFWPLFVRKFPPLPHPSWLTTILHPAAHPGLFAKEIAGMALLVYLGAAYGLGRRKNLAVFLRTGYLTDSAKAPPDKWP